MTCDLRETKDLAQQLYSNSHAVVQVEGGGRECLYHLGDPFCEAVADEIHGASSDRTRRNTSRTHNSMIIHHYDYDCDYDGYDYGYDCCDYFVTNMTITGVFMLILNFDCY